jgi:NAD(P)-dependent dehydrogenase (short-subunit alcohol dehydrogenase family)
MQLSGKVAVVTGAAGGIGSAVATRFAQEGARVVCADLDKNVGAVSETIQRAGRHAISVCADISTDDGNHECIEAAVNTFGGLDIFHANAAIQIMGSIEDTTTEQWNRLFTTNLWSAASGVRAALPEMRKRGGGSVIITSSLLGIVGDPDLPAYGAMKGGLRALCRSLAARYGPENIRVNTICPGDVETPLLIDFFAHQADPGAARRAILKNYPLGRFALPEDIAGVALFLASDDSTYITGTDLVVDGGLLAQIY